MEEEKGFSLHPWRQVLCRVDREVGLPSALGPGTPYKRGGHILFASGPSSLGDTTDTCVGSVVDVQMCSCNQASFAVRSGVNKPVKIIKSSGIRWSLITSFTVGVARSACVRELARVNRENWQLFRAAQYIPRT